MKGGGDGTASARAPTRERLVSAAREPFWLRGYEASSVANICARANANPGSLYHFFSTKEALLEAVLDDFEERMEAELLAPAWEGVEDPLGRIFALLEAYRRALIATDLTYGCPIGGLALELRAPPEMIRGKIAANFAAWRSAVLECLRQAEDRFPPDTDLDRLATTVLTIMEGGVMQARTFRSIEPFDAGVKLLREHLDMLEDRAAAATAS